VRRGTQLFERALTSAEACLGPEDPSVAVALANLAVVHREQGAVGQVREMLERTLHLGPIPIPTLTHHFGKNVR
jgi:Tfp pilus assembly protein PilF